jgi:hypothetical protein
MKEADALKILEKHGRFHERNPAHSRYSVRYPASSGRAMFGRSTRGLLNRLLRLRKAT